MQTNLGQLGVSQSSRLQGLLGQEMNTEGIEDWARGEAPRQATWDPEPTPPTAPRSKRR